VPIISFCQAGCADAQQNPPRRTRSEPAAQNAVRTRRAERGQNPPPLRLLAQDPTPRSSAQRKERASALPGLTLFARPVSTRSSALALGKSRRRLRGGRFAVAQNANRTRRSTRVAPASARPGSVRRHTFAGFAAASNPEALACAASGAAARATVIQPPAPTRARARPCPTRRRAKSWLPLRRLAGVR
jgi:hypothetical protein